MKKPLAHTRVTVKLRRSEYRRLWYLVVEAYPVTLPGGRAGRVVESVNRCITTPLWDKQQPTRAGGFKPRRDANGIILCRTDTDQQACIYADNVRKLRQHEYDSRSLYTDRESELAAQNERGAEDFVAYFKRITYSHHPKASRSVLIGWRRVGKLLDTFTRGQPVPFASINARWLEELKLFFLTVPQSGGKPGIVTQNTAAKYFATVKTALHQAFVDEYLTVDICDRVKGIPVRESRREALTIDEVNRLAATPCDDDIMRRASLFSILTGMRHCDIQRLRWRQLVRGDGMWRVDFTQKKTAGVEYTPISDQAYQLCGTRRQPDCLVFEGLIDPSWINRPLRHWLRAAGINRHITFHCFRHSFATLQLANGTDIYTVSKMLGHTNVRTTQIYTKIVDKTKERAANAIHIDTL